MNFDFDSNLEKLRSFLFVKRKASINAIKYVKKPTLKEPTETLFVGHISLQRRIRLQRYYFLRIYANIFKYLYKKIINYATQ